MRFSFSALILFLVAATCSTVGVQAAAPSHLSTASCTTTGYSKNCGGCRTLGASGSFSIAVPKAKITVKGSASSSSKGTKLCVTMIAAPKPSLGGVGLRVAATGPFSPLTVPGKTVYQVDPKTQAAKKITAIAAPGVYQAVG